MTIHVDEGFPKLLLTASEAADALGIGRSKTYELISCGALESVRIGKARRIPVEALEAFVGGLRAVAEG